MKHQAPPHDVILFDLDGTLSDPLEGIGRSINHALSSFGYPERELAALATHIGPPLDESFRTLTGESSPERIAALVSRYRERYGEVGYAENRLYPGVHAALQALRDRGAVLGVCTSKRVDFAERILEMFGLRHHFRFVSGGEIGTPKWQQVETLQSEGRLGRSPVMVGDRAVDIVAARRNGLQAAGVLWGHGSREELEREGPHYLLATPAELVGL